jgi:uncharacterized protein YegL
VVTDGASNDPDATKSQAAIVHNDSRNIQVIAIGVGGANMIELDNIATSSDMADKIIVEFSKFNVIFHRLKTTLHFRKEKFQFMALFSNTI